MHVVVHVVYETYAQLNRNFKMTDRNSWANHGNWKSLRGLLHNYINARVPRLGIRNNFEQTAQVL